MSHQDVIYQVELDIDADVAGEFDTWLAGHVEDMLAIAGFVSAEILADEDRAEARRVRRTVQYRVASREALDHYLAHDAERMRGEGLARFQGRFDASRRIFAASAAGAAPEELSACRNCGEPLTGQYCHLCGQRDKNRMISLWELIRDLVGDLFEVDSRLWRSLAPLLFRPGKLTSEYLAGRQVHYTPPLRMYLVLSIVFFVIASMGAQDTRIAINGESLADGEVSAAAQAESMRKCDDIEINFGWQRLDRPEVIAQIREICRRIASDQGRTFARTLYSNLPKMMFFFLPLIALVQKMLYIGSRRFYVEHLLFFVHYHAFFFLILTLTILLVRIPDLLPGQGVLTGLTIAAVSVYIPVYLFRAMRRVYGQGFFFTSVKYVLLVFAYIACMAITMAVGVLYTALSV